MTLFDENVSVVPAPARRRTRTTIVGLWSLAVAVVVLFVLTFLPTAYVIQQPGPVLNTLGTSKNADGVDVPLITVPDEKADPTTGQLDLLTVQVNGNRERTPTWIELALAWFDPSRAVVPIDRIFPSGQTTEQRNTENATLMTDSQVEASAAALRQLGYDVPQRIVVGSVTGDGAASGLLEPGDMIDSVDGKDTATADEIKTAIQAAGGQPVTFGVTRNDTPTTVTVTPRQGEVDGQQQWLVGIVLAAGFDLPVDVKIQLNDIGGPSAGMMFALGLIGKMSPGDLTGGHHNAGTRTLADHGQVGAIGGIRQKLYGARDAGATWFLAPSANCNEVVGHVPGGIRVFAVSTLSDSLKVLETIRDGGDLDALPTCDAGNSTGS